jgi:hypothetical protein
MVCSIVFRVCTTLIGGLGEEKERVLQVLMENQQNLDQSVAGGVIDWLNKS